MEPKKINTFFFIFNVARLRRFALQRTFPLFPYYKGRKSNKNNMIMNVKKGKSFKGCTTASPHQKIQVAGMAGLRSHLSQLHTIQHIVLHTIDLAVPALVKMAVEPIPQRMVLRIQIA